MRKRIATAAFGIPIFLAALWAGSWWLTVLLLLIAVLGMREYLRLVAGLGFKARAEIAYPAVGLIYLLVNLQRTDLLIPLFLLLLLVLAADTAINYHSGSIASGALCFFGVAYLGLLSILILLRRSEGGLVWSGLLIVITWVTDSGAYFTGLALGRHRLLPAVSPNKSVEGAVGGLVMATFAGAVIATVLPGYLQLWQGIAVAALTSIAGQLGDLLESALKRQAGVKDSGSLIPGHGGLLDRFDSMILAAPVFYLAVQLIKI